VELDCDAYTCDEGGAVAPAMSANDLRVGDTVGASGTYGGIPGLLLASSIRRVSARDPQIRGWQFVRDEPGIVMPGRSILTDATTSWNRNRCVPHG